MPEQPLCDRRVLIVEDEYLLADDLRYGLTKAGAIVVGMVSTVGDALELIDAGGEFDAAVLDVNLGGQPVFPVADRLSGRGVPFLFTTGYDASTIPPRFNGIERCEKPFDSEKIIRSLKGILKS